MKKLNEALGYLDEGLLDEAEVGIRRPKVKRSALLAAALAVMFAIGITAVGIRYFAPGIGIVYDSSVRVLAAMEKVQLGDVEIDTVMMTDMGDGTGTLSVWVYRAEEVEVDPEDAIKGIPPKELEDFAAIVDGVEYTRGYAGFGTSGFANYTYIDVPLTDTVTLRAGDETVTVTLNELAPGEQGGTIQLRGGKALTLFPVSESQNIWAMEYHDPFACRLAEDAYSVSTFAHLKTVRDDGESGTLSGSALLSGCPVSQRTNAEVGTKDYDKGVAKASLVNISHIFSYDVNSSIPEGTVTVPEPGETLPCDVPLYDRHGVTIRVISVTYGERGLEYEFDIKDKSGEILMGSVSATASAYVIKDLDYIVKSTGEHIYHKDAYMPVTNLSDRKWGVWLYDYEKDVDMPVVPGTKVTIRLTNLHYSRDIEGREITFH